MKWERSCYYDVHSHLRSCHCLSNQFAHNTEEVEFSDASILDSRLLWEFLRLAFSNGRVRRHTIIRILIDQLQNIYMLVGFFLNVYLVDYILSNSTPESSLVLVHDKSASLLVIVAITVLPIYILHFSDYAKTIHFGVGGEIRRMVQTGLMSRFLAYDEATRHLTLEGDLVMAMTRDTIQLVEDGYKPIIKLADLTGELFFVVLYQCTAPLVFGGSELTSLLAAPWPPTSLVLGRS